MDVQNPHSPDSQRAWELLVDRIERVEKSVDRAAERDDDAWSEYRRKCESEDKAKTTLLASTAAMVERVRAETAAMVERVRAEVAADIERARVLVAAESERQRVETADTLNDHRMEQFSNIDKRLKAVWAELRKRPGTTRPPFWRNVNGRFLIIAGLIALALLAVLFNARNLAELAGAILAKMAGH